MTSPDATKLARPSDDARSANEWLDPLALEADYGIRTSTQSVWRCSNRYGFRDLARKFGSRIRYRRSDIERWLNARTLSASDPAAK